MNIVLNLLWNFSGMSLVYAIYMFPFDFVYALFSKGGFERWRLSAYFAPFDVNCHWKKRFPHVDYPRKQKETTSIVSEIHNFQFPPLVRKLLEKLGYKIVAKRNYNYQLSAFLAQKLVDSKYENVCILYMKHTGCSNNCAVRGASRAKEHYNCDKAILVTYSTFTPETKMLADYYGVVLWGNHKLNHLFKKLRLPYYLTYTGECYKIKMTDYKETNYKETNYKETDYKETNYKETDYEETDYKETDYEDADSLTYEEIDNFDILDD